MSRIATFYGALPATAASGDGIELAARRGQGVVQLRTGSRRPRCSSRQTRVPRRDNEGQVSDRHAEPQQRHHEHRVELRADEAVPRLHRGLRGMMCGWEQRRAVRVQKKHPRHRREHRWHHHEQPIGRGRHALSAPSARRRVARLEAEPLLWAHRATSTPRAGEAAIGLVPRWEYEGSVDRRSTCNPTHRRVNARTARSCPAPPRSRSAGTAERAVGGAEGLQHRRDREVPQLADREGL